jgi:alpha-beta hydrolase superfamily lysophospholipase
MLEREGTLEGVGGARLAWRAWLPNGGERAAVVLLHGFGEHSGRYPTLIEHLVPRGYAIWAHDLRGHGRSSGPRGHLMSWAEFQGDLHRFIMHVQAEASGLPLLLYGHSLGGLIALEYGARQPERLAGIVVSAPALRWNMPVPLLWLATVVSAVRPGLSSGRAEDPEDPLKHARASVRLIAQEQAAMTRTNASAPTIRVPLLILHGTADTYVAGDASRAFYERVGSPDKTLLEPKGMGHFPHNEPGAEAFMHDVADWLDRHVV